MGIQERLYTVEEFLEFTRRPENENKRLELIEGVIVEMPPSSPLNTVVAMRLGRFLGQFVDERGLGYVTGADGGFQLGARNIRIPDVGFVSKGRVPELTGTVFKVAPDLAVEVISPSETTRQVLDKVREYLRAGTRLVWAIYPEDKIVDVHRMGEGDTMNVQTLRADSLLDGADVLPGFSLPLSELFG